LSLIQKSDDDLGVPLIEAHAPGSGGRSPESRIWVASLEWCRARAHRRVLAPTAPDRQGQGERPRRQHASHQLACRLLAAGATCRWAWATPHPPAI
jgi:hypothetical protein